MRSKHNKKYYEKNKSDPEFKATNNQKRKERNLKIHKSLTDEENNKIRERERQKVKKYRKKCWKSASNNSRDDRLILENFYKSNQGYCKAVKKAGRGLPESPRKKKLVICGLAKNHGVQLSDQMEKMLK